MDKYATGSGHLRAEVALGGNFGIPGPPKAPHRPLNAEVCDLAEATNELVREIGMLADDICGTEVGIALRGAGLESALVKKGWADDLGDLADNARSSASAALISIKRIRNALGLAREVEE